MPERRPGIDIGGAAGVGYAEHGVALHRCVHDIDGVAAQHREDEWPRRPLPAFDLVLSHEADEVVLLRRRPLGEFVALGFAAGAVDGAERRAIEVGKRRAHIEDARLQQRFLRWDRNLLIDEIGDACRFGAGDEGLAHGIQRRRLPAGGHRFSPAKRII